MTFVELANGICEVAFAPIVAGSDLAAGCGDQIVDAFVDRSQGSFIQRAQDNG